MKGHAMKTALRELTQVERESAAYNAAMSAARRGDREEHARLWRIYADTCAERCGAVVEAMEKARGLTRPCV